MKTEALAIQHDDGAEEARLEDRGEQALREVIGRLNSPASPKRLREAIAYAVFPGGARLRPHLCLSTAVACGDIWPERTNAAAAAVELVHCASLVHDDMPCFDDADLRRGKPTVHKAFDEATALLVGDALIVLAFETLARAGAFAEVMLLASSIGPSGGIIAGQAWESEPAVPLEEYHRAKTASLFEAAAGLGATSAGADPLPWRSFGEMIGRAFQAADDLADAISTADRAGKTTGRDVALGRPSIVRALGLETARRRVRELVDEARARVPPCRGKTRMFAWIDDLAARLGLP